MDIATRLKFTNKIAIHKEISGGGDWLGSARRWMQSNIKDGDRLSWSSPETVHVPFYKLEEFAQVVAAAAIAEDRKKIKLSENNYTTDGGASMADAFC